MSNVVKWYVQINNRVNGPHSIDQLIDGVRSGKLQPTTPTRSEEMPSWRPLNEIMHAHLSSQKSVSVRQPPKDAPGTKAIASTISIPTQAPKNLNAIQIRAAQNQSIGNSDKFARKPANSANNSQWVGIILTILSIFFFYKKCHDGSSNSEIKTPEAAAAKFSLMRTKSLTCIPNKTSELCQACCSKLDLSSYSLFGDQRGCSCIVPRICKPASNLDECDACCRKDNEDSGFSSAFYDKALGCFCDGMPN